jgi:hypothetical protein
MRPGYQPRKPIEEIEGQKTWRPTSTGTFTTKLSGDAAGSGIGTVKTRPDMPAGDVILIAPQSVVNVKRSEVYRRATQAKPSVGTPKRW